MGRAAEWFLWSSQKVLLVRCKRTRCFLRQGGWTADVKLAQVFESEVQAVRSCVYRDLRNVELVFRDSHNQLDVFSVFMR